MTLRNLVYGTCDMLLHINSEITTEKIYNILHENGLSDSKKASVKTYINMWKRESKLSPDIMCKNISQGISNVFMERAGLMQDPVRPDGCIPKQSVDNIVVPTAIAEQLKLHKDFAEHTLHSHPSDDSNSYLSTNSLGAALDSINKDQLLMNKKPIVLLVPKALEKEARRNLENRPEDRISYPDEVMQDSLVSRLRRLAKRIKRKLSMR